MYKLIIADDEDSVREGMCTIINWSELGFEVLRVCSDGDEVLRYLEAGGEADALLTDIRMIHASGLDLAKYAMERRPEMKVVFLSGYREFEYARAAAQYNVRYYLLKPTQLSEIYRVFGEIRQALDGAQALKQKERQSRLDVKRALGQYFERMTDGELPAQETGRAFRLLASMGLDAQRSPGIMFRLRVAAEEAGDIDRTYMKDAILRGYEHLILDEAHDVCYVPFAGQGAALCFAAFARGIGEVQALVRRDFDAITQTIRPLFGVAPCIEVLGKFDGIGFFTPERRTGDAPAQEAGDTPEALRVNLARVHQRILAQMRVGETDGLREAADDLERLLAPHAPSVRLNAIIETANAVYEQLKTMSPALLAAPDYASLYRTPNEDAQIAWLRGVMESVRQGLEAHAGKGDIRVIFKAKAYVDLHYSEQISLRDVAASVYLSPAYFSRLFKQYTHENITDYIAHSRVEKAKLLLLEGRYKVYEVSERVGYPNHKYFFRIFKKYTGQTPFDYGKRSPREART
ncbi:MAG TPA: response regulator [Clostridia bacterium]|nr:response regulator [Clostridia bacterium]